MNENFYEKGWKNELFKRDQGVVYVPPKLAIEVIDNISSLDSLKNKYDKTLKTGEQFTIIVINALSGTLAQAARERLPEARIICLEYFPYEIVHLRNKMGFEVVDLKMDVNNFTIEYMNSKLQQKIKKEEIACVLGNPPYHVPNSPTYKIWEDFVRLSFNNIVPVDSFVVLIHPLNWMSNKDNMFVNFWKTKHVFYCNIHECERHFKDIDTSIGYNIIQNSPSHENFNTPVVTLTGTHCVNFFEYTSLPNDVSSTVMEILSVVLLPEQQQGINFVRSSETGTAKIVKDQPTTTHKYPVFRGWSKKEGILWGFSQIPHRWHNHWKVIFQEFSTNNKGFFVDTNAATENGYMMVCNSELEANNLRQLMLSKLYQFCIQQIKLTRTIRPHVLNRLPLLDISRSWTDQELYEHFDIDKIPGAVELIERTVL